MSEEIKPQEIALDPDPGSGTLDPDKCPICKGKGCNDCESPTGGL